MRIIARKLRMPNRNKTPNKSVIDVKVSNIRVLYRAHENESGTDVQAFDVAFQEQEKRKHTRQQSV